MAQPQIAPGFDLTDPDLYANRVPQHELAELRRAAPVWWNPQPSDMGFNDDGFWAVTKHRDVVAISRDSETFSSYENTAIIRFLSGSTRDQNSFFSCLLHCCFLTDRKSEFLVSSLSG